MKKQNLPVISERKKPRQARSAELVADILEAAIRVLAREGAHRFTTVRVAEEAGVSVGSLYQYFPNKEALLFRLQTDEWKDTAELLGELLGDESRPPSERLGRTVKAFFRSELEEAELRVALGDARALYRDVPETKAHRELAISVVHRFLDRNLPGLSEKKRAFAAEVLMTTLSSIGKSISEEERSRTRIDAWAEVVTEMLVGHLDRLAGGSIDLASRRPSP